MRDSPGASPEAPASWLSSFALCYAPFVPCLSRERRRVPNRNHSSVVRKQPLPRATPLPALETESGGKEDMETKNARRQRRTKFSAREKGCSDAASRRPLISAPSDFRHLYSGPFHEFPGLRSPPQQEQRFTQHEPTSGPRDGSKHTPDSRAPPFPSRFDFVRAVTPPPPAYIASLSDEEDYRQLNQSNYSPMSFHIPRRQDAASSPPTDIQGGTAPKIPPRAQGRARPYTAPHVEALKERVASAMIEAERLQQQIDEIIERQSLYSNSRPSTPRSTSRAAPAMEPMPSIPALPPAAPSFAERLNLDARRSLSATVGSGTNAFHNAENDSVACTMPPPFHHDSRAFAPPPPLTPRPPLRKKKSFTHMSNWLVTGTEHNDNGLAGFTTNVPKPAVGTDRMCQYATATDTTRRQSYDSLEYVSTWDTDDGERTAATTTWSLGSSSAAKHEHAFTTERSATFGTNEAGRARSTVGVAV